MSLRGFLTIRMTKRERSQWHALAESRGFSSLAAYVRHLVMRDAQRAGEEHPEQLPLTQRPKAVQLGISPEEK